MQPEKKPRQPRRAASQSSITFSLPKKLKQAIFAAAKAEKRTASNYLVSELGKLLGVKEED